MLTRTFGQTPLTVATLACLSLVALAEPPKIVHKKTAVEVLASPEDDVRRYWEASRQMAPKPPQTVIDRIVARGAAHPDDAQAVYWAAQVGADGLADVPDFMDMMRRSAERGIAPAMAAYGAALCGGTVVPRDVDKGIKLLKQACDAGEPTAFYHLGLVYFAGVPGLPRDLDRAEANLKQAVDKGVTFALVLLTKVYVARHDVPRALEYAQKAAEAGSYEMMAFLAECYSGSGALPLNDMGKAIHWARRGALLNDPASMRVYAYLLMGDLPEGRKDLVLSRRMLQRAADLGDNEAAACLQSGKVDGMFGESNPREGIAALEKMAVAGITEAKWHLGRTLYGDKGVPPELIDKPRGLRLIRAAAAEGYVLAKKFLAVLDAQGDPPSRL